MDFQQNKELCLRKVRQDDRDLLFDWANDRETRKNSFSTKEIAYDEHCAWFAKMMENDNCVQYILMKKQEPIGQIRLDIHNNFAEISYSIAKSYRGQGYGGKALELIKKEVFVNMPDVYKLVARVKSDNIASNKVFLREGYVETYRQYEIYKGNE